MELELMNPDGYHDEYTFTPGPGVVIVNPDGPSLVFEIKEVRNLYTMRDPRDPTMRLMLIRYRDVDSDRYIVGGRDDCNPDDNLLV